MSPDFVRNSVSRRPFRPFIIHVAGGRTISVPSPEFIGLSAGGRLTLVQYVGNAHVIDLLLVTDLEFRGASILD